MGLKRHNKYYEIAGKENYLPPGETHLREVIINPQIGKDVVTKNTLVGWYIGYYEGNNKKVLRVFKDSKEPKWDLLD